MPDRPSRGFGPVGRVAGQPTQPEKWLRVLVDGLSAPASIAAEVARTSHALTESRSRAAACSMRTVERLRGAEVDARDRAFGEVLGGALAVLLGHGPVGALGPNRGRGDDDVGIPPAQAEVRRARSDLAGDDVERLPQHFDDHQPHGGVQRCDDWLGESGPERASGDRPAPVRSPR
jgi:hypothetical protein